jgi:hypothetical protein
MSYHACIRPVLLAAMLLGAAPAADPFADLLRPLVPDVAAEGVDGVVADTVARLRRRFDADLADPQRYRKQALADGLNFPEGRIYPFALPAMAYAHLCARPGGDAAALATMRGLVDQCVVQVAAELKAPAGDLTRLDGFAKQGTFTTTLALVLTSAALVGDDRHAAVRDHLIALLVRDLTAKAGAPIDSYPTYTWYFDTIAALAAVQLDDRRRGTAVAVPLLAAHLAWRQANATDPATGLTRAHAGAPPRGCDLPMQVLLLAHADPVLARTLYDGFARTFWTDQGVIAGFAEWPPGTVRTADIDSGPVLFGVGATATGIGAGAAIAVGDRDRLRRLAASLAALPRIVPLLLSDGSPGKAWFSALPTDPTRTTGFAYGDCALFYALTWTRLPAAKR